MRKYMTEKQAKRHLSEMLRSFTVGSVLHLLADLHRDAAEQARKADDAMTYRRCRLVEHALFVVGLGIDAASPS
jgi:hypothetical protein